jgi:hypothetical protein
MGKDKIRRFAELHTFSKVIEADFDEVFKSDHNNLIKYKIQAAPINSVQ